MQWPKRGSRRRRVKSEERKSKMCGKSAKVQHHHQCKVVGSKVSMMMMSRMTRGMRWCNKSAAAITCLVLVSSIMGLAGAVSRGGLQSEDSAPPNKVQKCREGCLDKVRD